MILRRKTSESLSFYFIVNNIRINCFIRSHHVFAQIFSFGLLKACQIRFICDRLMKKILFYLLLNAFPPKLLLFLPWGAKAPPVPPSGTLVKEKAYCPSVHHRFWCQDVASSFSNHCCERGEVGGWHSVERVVSNLLAIKAGLPGPL